MRPAKADNLAELYSKHPDIKITGVTKENHVVTTKECVDYRRSVDDLKVVYKDGKKIKV